ncbi:MAG: peptidylprolyl isomerase, partial [Bacteroidota bacterium]
KGALSAARTSDNINPQRASSGSQFYVVQGSTVTDDFLNRIEATQNITYTPEERALYKELGGTPHLDNQYTVFGEVVEGMEIIDQIAAVPTAPGDRPIEDVKMKIRIVYE